jgi:hypothetical protein
MLCSLRDVYDASKELAAFIFEIELKSVNTRIYRNSPSYLTKRRANEQVLLNLHDSVKRDRPVNVGFL